MVGEAERFTIPFVGNTYCGPAALAYLLRSDPGTAARHIRLFTGKRSVHGTPTSVMTAVLGRHGYRAIISSPGYSWIETKLTLKAWLETRIDSKGEYLVNITGHYVIVHGSLLFDNRHHLGIELDRCEYLRKRVVKAWRIVKK